MAGLMALGKVRLQQVRATKAGKYASHRSQSEVPLPLPLHTPEACSFESLEVSGPPETTRHMKRANRGQAWAFDRAIQSNKRQRMMGTEIEGGRDDAKVMSLPSQERITKSFLWSSKWSRCIHCCGCQSEAEYTLPSRRIVEA